MTKKFILTLIIFLILPIACAQEIVVKASPVKNVIDYNETARFVITIENHQSTTDRFLLGSTPRQLGPGTLWRFIPQSIEIGPGGTGDIVLDITPPKDIRIGVYELEILAYSANDPSIRGTTNIRLQITSEYPHLTATIGVPTETYPGTIPANVIVENDGAETVGNITAVLESDLFGPFELEIGTLKPGETRLVFNQDITIPTSTEVVEYMAKINFYQNGEYLNEVEKKIKILGKENLAIARDVSSNFLSTKYKVTLTNVGNVFADTDWSNGFTKWQRFFVHASPKQDRIDIVDGVANFVWAVKLAPGKSTVIEYEINYSPILALILSSIFLAYVLIWYLRKEIYVAKSAKTEKDYVKVNIVVKNESPEPKVNVIVEDYVPMPLKIVKDFGTLVPTAIKKERGLTKLVWKFDALAPFEERILSYGLKSRLSVVGVLLLPATVVKCRIDKRVKKFYSNTVPLKGKIKVEE